LVLLALAMPIVFQAPKIDTVGIYWQGRYSLPLAVGLPLVASTVQARRGSRRSSSRWVRPITVAGILLVGTAIVAAQVAAFLTALHRYQTGLGAAPGAPVRWQPPGGTPLVIALLVAGLALALGLFAWMALAPGPSVAPGPPHPPEPLGTDRSEVTDDLTVPEDSPGALEPTG